MATSPDEECEMGNISGKYQPVVRDDWPSSKRLPSFAQGNREAQFVTAPAETATPFACDSLDPKVCFDIYRTRPYTARPTSITRSTTGQAP
jgi:hypothetical protein